MAGKKNNRSGCRTCDLSLFIGPIIIFIVFLLITNWAYYSFSTKDKGYGSLIMFLVGAVYVPLFSALLLFVLSLWIGWKCHEQETEYEDMMKYTITFGVIAALLTFAALFYTMTTTGSGVYAQSFGGDEVTANAVATALLFAVTGAAIGGIGSVIGRVANKLM
jgi:heme/copper-type cytochrome/quinol oxidase subunit 2